MNGWRCPECRNVYAPWVRLCAWCAEHVAKRYPIPPQRPFSPYSPTPVPGTFRPWHQEVPYEYAPPSWTHTKITSTTANTPREEQGHA